MGKTNRHGDIPMSIQPVSSLDRRSKSRKAIIQLTEIKRHEAGEAVGQSESIITSHTCSLVTDNHLERCVDDYLYVPGYLASVANYKGGVLLKSLKAGKRLIFMPDGTFLEFSISDKEIIENSAIPMKLEDVCNAYDQLEVTHEIDRALGEINLSIADHHKKTFPDKYWNPGDERPTSVVNGLHSVSRR